MPLAETAARLWEDDILPALTDYIAIPNLSPAFEPDWAAKGHMADAVELVRAWCAARPIEGMTVDVHQLPGRTPVLLVDIPASGAGGAGGAQDTVLLYGHLDKQPPMTGWLDGLGPWTPVRRAERLYGRGGADDGYAAFASLAAIEAVRAEGASHAGASCSSRPARSRAAPTCPPTSKPWPTGWAPRRWWSASTRAAPPSTGCGPRPRCGAWPASPSRCGC